MTGGILSRSARESARHDLAGRAARALAGVAGGSLHGLPVTLRFWDGSTLAAEGPDAPVIRVRDPSAIAHVVRSRSR